MSADSSSSSTPSIEVLLLTHQLRAFINQSHQKSINQGVANFVRSVTQLHPLPDNSSDKLASIQLHLTRSRSAIQDPRAPISFPPSWLDSTAEYENAVATLLDAFSQPGPSKEQARPPSLVTTNERSAVIQRVTRPTPPMSNESFTPPDGLGAANTPNLTEEDRNRVRQLVSQSIREVVTQLGPQQGSSGVAYPDISAHMPLSPRNNVVSPEPVTQVIKDEALATFKPDVVGYFYPDLSPSYSKDDIVHNGKETVYRDVHAFVDRPWDMLAWYSTQLTTLQKDGLRGGEGINNWIDLLTENTLPLTPDGNTSLQITSMRLFDERKPQVSTEQFNN